MELRFGLTKLQLEIGDSLRREINKGLSKSRFGVVILSQNFFHKGWTNYELDGLVSKEMVVNLILIYSSIDLLKSVN